MRKGNRINYTYPWIIGIIFLIVSILLGLVPKKMEGYENILESIIQFSGLVIGFYTAMYGLVLVSANTKLFKRFKSEGVDKIFQSNLTQSLTASFLAYIFSVVMQELQYHDEIKKFFKINYSLSNLGFKIWILTVGVFLGMSYRTIRLLLKMLFIQFVEQEKVLSTTSHESSEEKRERYNKLRR